MTATPSITVRVNAEGAAAALQQVADAVSAINAPPPKGGLRTTEFWATAVAPMLLALATFIWHRDFSGYVQAAALAAAGISTAIYSLGRAHLKRPVDLKSVLYDLHALTPIGREVASTVEQVGAALPVNDAARAK